jgi:hypothetical protein
MRVPVYRMTANIVFSSFLPVCCLYAIVRGAAPERCVAVALVLAAIATAVTGIGLAAPGEVRWGVFAVDTALLMALLAITLRARRFWTLPLCSLQLLTVLAHCAHAMIPESPAWPYAASIMWTSLLMPPILAYGTYCHRQRLKLTGADRSWRISSRPSPATLRTS